MKPVCTSPSAKIEEANQPEFSVLCFISGLDRNYWSPKGKPGPQKGIYI